jgi:hypothetical protein
MMMATLSFATDIRPLFADIDVDHMKPAGMDLSSKDSVTANAAKILVVVTSGAMPPPGEQRRWTPEMCDTFKLWIDQGCPP